MASKHNRARDAGLPERRPKTCPGCKSRNIVMVPTLERLRAQPFGLPKEIGTCRACKAIWEPFPKFYVNDPVCSEPCDNCAFRPGAPEQQDKEAWNKLISGLMPDQNGMFTGRFYCHKNVPIDMTKGPGNHLHPTRPDGSYDTQKMRVCSGFLRMFWALRDKQIKSGAAA